jgi:sec-independent protein translocase protein TatB
MESFFGIGVFELVFIFIFALIFLGPERLPQVMRQVLGFIRQVRELSSDISKQINDEFGDLGELDPRRQVKQIMDEATAPIKDATAPVKKELTNTAKSTATPKANANAVPKKTVAKAEPAAKPVAKTVPAQKSDDAELPPEAMEKADGTVATSPEVAATTESTAVAVSAVEDGHMNGGAVEAKDHKAEASLNGTVPGAVEAPAENSEEGHTIAPPSLLQAETSARAEESQAEREPVAQRAAEEGSV